MDTIKTMDETKITKRKTLKKKDLDIDELNEFIDTLKISDDEVKNNKEDKINDTINTQNTIINKEKVKINNKKNKIVVEENKIINEEDKINDIGNKINIEENKINGKSKKTKKIIVKDNEVNEDNKDNKDNEVNEDNKVNEVNKNKKVKKTKKKETIINDKSYLKVPVNEIVYELKDDNKDKSKNKSEIIQLIDNAHNLLYNEENIEGEDALNDIMNFMFLKLIQPLLSDKPEDGKIDLLNKEHYKKIFPKYETNEQLIETLTYFTDFNNLINKDLLSLRDMKVSIDCIRLMGKILKEHPLTGQIFTELNFIKTKKASTIVKLINNVIEKMDIKKLEENEDVIGEIYEHIINDYVKKGSKLGQFFTPRKMANLLLNYKNKDIIELISKLDTNNKIKICDTCFGTGGLIISNYNLLKENYKDRIEISGGELKPSTFQYGLMNMILTLKKIPENVICESSLTHVNNYKNTIIFTNPPFQTDKKYDTLLLNFNSDTYTKNNKIVIDDIYKLKSNNPPVQFLELNLFKLDNNGMCIIILPYGQLFFGSSFKKIRKYFMDNINITDIVIFEGGIFTHTDIKTCALIFTKNGETKNINFIQANKECNKLTKILSISIEEINKEPNLSWSVNTYIKNEIKTFDKNIEYIEFENIFTLEKGKIQSSKVEEDINSDITFINLSSKSEFIKIKYDDMNILDNENIFISNIMPLGLTQYFNGKCIYSNLLHHIIIKDEWKNKINIKYIYYFLKYKEEYIKTNYEKGSSNKSLDIDNFNRMLILIPSIEQQNYIVEYINFINKCNKTNMKKINELYKLNNYCINNIVGDDKQLNNICEKINGPKKNSSLGKNNGLYPLYYCSILGNLYLDTFDYNNEGIIINKTNGSGKCMVYYGHTNYNVGETVIHFKSNDDNYLTKYIYYYLFNNLIELEKHYIGCNQKSINDDDLFSINIKKITLEKQKQIIDYCDNNEKLIELLKNDIINNENQIKLFINSLEK